MYYISVKSKDDKSLPIHLRCRITFEFVPIVVLPTEVTYTAHVDVTAFLTFPTHAKEMSTLAFTAGIFLEYDS